ncbi:related to Autophagy-related protein 2 [Zygosaccharomyces bailii ISA1307]|nr:related to Autophagy-related protein 2 [Zygosaccharomyces bailii ISA1307]
MAFWLPQMIQKRLLLYVLQQVSVFSSVDLSNLHVSLGSSSQFSFNDVNLVVDEISIPGLDMQSGTITHLDIRLNVSGGVSVYGKGIELVVRPQCSTQDSDSGNFSLAKSIQDLTNSIMQFKDSNQTGVSNVENELNSEFLTSPATTSSSSSLSSREEIEAAPAVSTLETVKNRILNVALSKLMITFEDVTFKLLFEDYEVIEVKLEKICLKTGENNVRKITVHNLDAIKMKTNVDVPKNLSSTIYYSQSESASMYMSAMESPKNEPVDSNEEQSGSVTDLIRVNSIDISFEGLASIEDLSLRDLMVDVDIIRIFADNWLDVGESVLDFVIAVLSKEPTDKTSQPSGLTGYKRFKKEQDILEGIAFLAIKSNVIQMDLAQNFTLLLRTVNLDSLGNKEYVVTVDSFEFRGDGLSSSHPKSPIIRGIIKPKESRLSILHDVNISLTIPALEELLTFSQRITEFLSSFESKLSKKSLLKKKSSEGMRFLTATRCINITLPLAKYDLILKVENAGSNTSSDIFKTNSLKILRRRLGQIDVLLNISGVCVTLSKSRIQLDAYDENLDDSLLTSKILCTIKDITLEDDFVMLQGLLDEFRHLSLLFSAPRRKKDKERKNSYLKRSVRILHSSNLIYKNTAAASFALMVDSIKLRLKSFLKREFGTLDGKLTDITFATTQEGNFVAFAKHLILNRLFGDNEQAIVSPIKPTINERPIFFFQRKNNGRTRITLCNLSFHYYAKWLDLFSERNSKSKRPTSNEKSNAKKELPSNAFAWELKLIDCSVFLLPYRLNAGLMLVVDRMAMNGKSFFLQSKSLLNSGTLLLVDDVCNIKRQDNKEWSSLTSLYAHQGFSAIGKIDTLSIITCYANSTISLHVKLHNLMLSLCADSAHTLIQLCIDLKLPVTFPDEDKYNYNDAEVADVFNEIDPDFFNSSHIKQEGKINNKDDLIVVEDIFLDGAKPRDVANEINSIGSIDETTIDTSSDFTSRTINFHEGYLDIDRGEEETQVEDHEQDIEFKIEVDVEKVSIKLFDGYDWKYSRNFISLTIDQLDREVKAIEGEHPVDGKVQMSVFDSIYVTADTSDDVDLKKRVSEEIQGEKKSSVSIKKANLHPSRFYKALISLEKIKLSFTGYRYDNPSKFESDGSADTLNKCDLSVQKFEILDNVPTSTWNKFMTLSRHEQWSRDRAMLCAQFSTVRPIDYLMATEMITKLEVAPLRLHVDQDALDFLVKFGEFKDKRFELIDDYPDTLFMQKFTTNSVKLKLDYKPKKVDYAGLRSGHTSELMNFFILEGAKLTLKGVVLYGVNGFPDMASTLKAVWAPDIASKQLPGVLEGFAPVKSIAALGSGVKALVTVPLTEYRQDRRLGKSLKNGCNVFLKTATGDFVKVGVKLASGTQAILENTEGIFGGVGVDGRLPRSEEPVVNMDSLLKEDQLVGGSNPKIRGQRPAALVIDPYKTDGGQPKIVSLYADQPLDLHKGLEEAYLSLEKHMHLVYDVLWKTKGEIEDCQAGTAAAAVTAAKVAPVAIIRPVIGATEAVVRTLQGISNQFDKDQIRGFNDKYKSQTG